MNFLHNDEDEERVHAAYGERYDRLADIKAQYDPANIFRNNQNIAPVRRLSTPVGPNQARVQT